MPADLPEILLNLRRTPLSQYEQSFLEGLGILRRPAESRVCHLLLGSMAFATSWETALMSRLPDHFP